MPASYHPHLINALRRTLKHIEREVGSRNDPTLLELKTLVVRTLAERELAKEEESVTLDAFYPSKYVN